MSTEIIGLTPPRESAPFICLSCLSSSSTFLWFLYQFLLKTYSNWRTSRWLKFVAGRVMLIWTEGAGIIWFWMTEVQFKGYRDWTPWILYNQGRWLALKPPYYCSHHVSRISELALHLIKFSNWNPWLLDFLVVHHCVESSTDWTAEWRGCSLGAIVELHVLSEGRQS